MTKTSSDLLRRANSLILLGFLPEHPVGLLSFSQDLPYFSGEALGGPKCAVFWFWSAYQFKINDSKFTLLTPSPYQQNTLSCTYLMY